MNDVKFLELFKSLPLRINNNLLNKKSGIKSLIKLIMIYYIHYLMIMPYRKLKEIYCNIVLTKEYIILIIVSIPNFL